MSAELSSIDAQIDDLTAQAGSLISSLRDVAGRAHRIEASELQAIEAFVGKTRKEIAALAPVAIAKRRIPEAGAELSAIVRDSGAAIDTILSAAEELLGFETDSLEAYRSFVAERAVAILEACGIHDLTGQRVSKVAEALNLIEARTHRFATELNVADDPEVESAGRESDGLINGPALTDANQTVIDDLFGDGAHG